MRAIGESLANKPQLSRALWSDMFVSRLKTELPPALVRNLTSTHILYIVSVV